MEVTALVGIRSRGGHDLLAEAGELHGVFDSAADQELAVQVLFQLADLFLPPAAAERAGQPALLLRRRLYVAFAEDVPTREAAPLEPPPLQLLEPPVCRRATGQLHLAFAIAGFQAWADGADRLPTGRLRFLSVLGMPDPRAA
ncbi:hypothetical protein [Streptomyces sp. NPDC058295]|uniref:hypothetical protein n=1 Tax=Streptomyces sp. NPDC058295 TaxID=3346431 RepID=UPI0036DFAB4D